MYEKKSIYVKIVRGILMPCSVNYTHKRPLRGHCAPPLQKPSQSVCIIAKRHKKTALKGLLLSKKWSG